MRTMVILFLVLFTTSIYAQISENEEAIILNQELQYLEDSVNNIQSISVNKSEPAQRKRALNEKSLERTYFGEDSEEDVITTRTSAPKRRGL